MTSSASPPILPVSNSLPTNATAGTTTSVESQPPIATPAFRAFITHLSDSLRNGLAQRRPWGELVDRSAFTKPESLSEATLRIRKNYSYFRVNYLAVAALILAFSLLSHPFSLIVLIGLLASWLFLYLFRPSDQPLVIFGRTFSDFETLALLGGLTVFVVFLTSVGSLLISALMVGVALICAHGAFRVPEDLFLDDQENNPATGFLSFIRGAATNAAVTASVPAVSARV
ncbi:PRA1 family protein [Quillaja saponaria]|uniref:PRA1 family protein n=1 Tax=Quillaja saponaria TaxID=32244 RepID=A0AAD7LN16_QUISA|nr:PRA1 family protein [Quillaja saponaria]KAJ7961161.1 PRA1 family protein [Quillaja saponaria]